jgi:hypothetical protein
MRRERPDDEPEPDDSDEDDPAEEQRALARSGQLQLRMLSVLNDPVERWNFEPGIAAHGCAWVLARLLTDIVRQDANRLPWALDLLDDVRTEVADSTTSAGERAGLVH